MWKLILLFSECWGTWQAHSNIIEEILPAHFLPLKKMLPVIVRHDLADTRFYRRFKYARAVTNSGIMDFNWSDHMVGWPNAMGEGDVDLAPECAIVYCDTACHSLMSQFYIPNLFHYIAWYLNQTPLFQQQLLISYVLVSYATCRDNYIGGISGLTYSLSNDQINEVLTLDSYVGNILARIQTIMLFKKHKRIVVKFAVLALSAMYQLPHIPSIESPGTTKQI